jgi:diaminohydroxyphosphoribosylaminopyrimidine deaminase/5-amino-6-(5-phosphoribosylamino)uracil reductase
MSMDGRTAMASGESKWLTGTAARSDVQWLRARSCAVVSGVDTVLADNAALNVRASELGLEQGEEIARRQPLRVILDSALRLRPPLRLLSGPGRVVVATQVADRGRWQHLQEHGAEVIELPATAAGGIDLRALMAWLHGQQCNEVMVEAGARLAGSFWRAGLVDWLTLYMAPTLLGSAGRPLLDLPLEQMRQQQRLTIRDWRAVGNDWRIDAVPLAGSRTAAGES